jgi:preflagellin peptidase FlaK
VDTLDALRLAAGIAILGAASVMDLRTRRVPNAVWAVGGAVALAMLAAELAGRGASALAYLGLLPIGLLLFDALWDRPAIFEEGSRTITAVVLLLYAGAAAAFAFLALNWQRGALDADSFLLLASVPGMILLVYGFYAAGLLRGGADAKALMEVAVLVPVYPAVGGLPVFPLDPRLAGTMELTFPFALVTLLNAAILTLLVPLFLLARNAVRGDVRLPLALFGQRVPIDEVPKFSWLMERVVDGEVETRLMPRGKVDVEGELEKLRQLGRSRVWVTPQLPFILMILLGFLAGFALGNVFFVVIGLAA